MPRLVVAALLLLPVLDGCASQECDLHSECPASHYCLRGLCQQECNVDFDCPSGLTCSVIGRCVSDAGVTERDAGPPGGVDAGPPGVDAGPPGVDAGPRMDAAPGSDAGPPVAIDSGVDAGADSGGSADAGPGGMTPRGTYRYQMLPVSLGDAVRVAFHPDGSYAVVLERSNVLHVYDWAARTTQRVDLNPPGSANVYFHDLAFEPGGRFAIVAAADVDSGGETGVLIRLDDAMIRAGMAAAGATRLTETRAGERFTAVEFPLPPRVGRPIVLSTTTRSPYIARLRELDTASGTFMGLFEARATSAGCNDLAFADNAFGGWGVVVVCGINGGDAPYYTIIGAGPGAWSPGPSATLGNTFRVASHPTGAYALAIGASGSGNIHRFEAGAWRPASSSPTFTTRSLLGVAFQPDGTRALALGRAGGSPLTGAVLEYRHDLWTTADVTDVSIPGFSAPPYSADSSYYLNDAAFRTGCDGGLIVGGRSSFSVNRGLLIEFRVEGLRGCGGVL